MPTGGSEARIAELVDDQEIDPGELGLEAEQPFLVARLDQLVDQVGGGGEAHAEALLAGGSELLFDVFSRRYENGATIVTSNLPLQGSRPRWSRAPPRTAPRGLASPPDTPPQPVPVQAISVFGLISPTATATPFSPNHLSISPGTSKTRLPSSKRETTRWKPTSAGSTPTGSRQEPSLAARNGRCAGSGSAEDSAPTSFISGYIRDSQRVE